MAAGHPRRALAYLAFAWFSAGSVGFGMAQASGVTDLNGRLVDPFHVPSSTRAIVFVFVSTDCPISNRYAPDVRTLFETFRPKGVVFWLVYPNGYDSVDGIRNHVAAFNYPATPLRDPRHALVTRFGVAVTPEAVVVDRQGRQAYRGRLDDRMVSLGVERQVPTRFDLRDAIGDVLAGRPVRSPATDAVGCYIAG